MARRTSWTPWLGLVAVAFVAYVPAWHGGLLWDDDAHLTRTALRSWEGLWRIWTEPGATQQYYPVLHSVFWVLHRLWGDATTGYHLVNIALHAAASGVFVLLLRSWRVPGAMLAGYLFALHPVQAESVAWISELKNTLSTVAYLGAALLYTRFDADRRSASYLAASSLFVLALLTKSVTASLPAALLVVAWWQRGSLNWRRDVAPLLPWFAAAVAAGLMTIWMERTHVGAVGAPFDLSLVERGLVAGRALWFYLLTWVWPYPLSFVYPRWIIDQAVWWQWTFPVAALVTLAVSWRLWRAGRTGRGPLTVALLFAGALFPALGFFDVYPFMFSWVADHFMYLATLPLAAATAVLLTTRLRDARTRQVAAVALCLVLGVLTWRQAATYRDAETLYLATLERNPDAWLAHLNLGWLRLQRGQLDAAVRHSEEALRLQPELPEAWHNLGVAKRLLGDLPAAETALRRSLTLQPETVETRYNLSLVLIDQGRPTEALPHLDAWLAESPNDAGAHAQRGDALQSLSRFDEAVMAYRASLRLDASNVKTRTNLGSALGRSGRHGEALEALREALRIDPGYTPAARNLGFALLNLGRVDEAIAVFEDVVRRAPSDDSRADLEYARSIR